jgi:4'-phosphopantetheinyl transferase
VDLKTCPAQRLPEVGGVDVWHFQCQTAPLATSERLARTLSEEERVTAGRLRDSALRSRYIANHAAMRAILALYAPGLVVARRRSGKPYIAAPESARQLRFNMAHSGTLCVVAIATGREVGVDVERVRRDIALDEIAQLYFTPGELAALRRLPENGRAEAFFVCWTRKEALLKAQGTGFLRPPHTVHVGLEASDLRCSGWTATGFDFSPGYAGAVALEGTRITLRVHEFRMSSEGRSACMVQMSRS